MLSQTSVSRALLLILFMGIMYAFYVGSNSHEPDPVVRESYECIVKICSALPGAGDACTVQKARITKITFIDDGGAKTVRFTPTNDRCANGSD